ncbi:3-hydroxyacyl-CoA dehydrogenase [Afipia sp. P52-10]|uniref:SDR family oxidoreductase n=1 Tax=Afipia sp. P52-10 TaxID=1429916 RepID=UPI0003DF36A5|nr:SDR family oxidoreductase [Afipia sp. P52-10]ETR78055.1 3-hydroxyacyl-CoA dehydrogenase [Afipia sp. P52-10]
MAGIVEGKVAIVTGGGGAIGSAIARLLAKEGAKVVVNDVGGSVFGTDQNDLGPAQKTVADIKAAGGEAIANGDSVSSWESAQKIVQAARDTYGKIDLVVNNAGIIRMASFHKMMPKDWEDVINVHLHGSFYVARAAAPHMREQKSGAFVHMASTAGLVGTLGMANYAAAKIGICGLSRSIAIDMGHFGIRSNAIAPAAHSRMIDATPNQTPEMAARIERRQRVQKPEHIANLAVFLLSDAAKTINGQIFGARGPEIYLYNQPRPIRTLFRSGGWEPKVLAEQLPQMLKTSLTPLERTGDVFSWDVDE